MSASEKPADSWTPGSLPLLSDSILTGHNSPKSLAADGEQRISLSSLRPSKLGGKRKGHLAASKSLASSVVLERVMLERQARSSAIFKSTSDFTSLTAKSSAVFRDLSPPQQSVKKAKSIKDEVIAMSCELDANIAKVMPPCPVNMSPREQAEMKMKVLQFYNYTFNRLILQERTICSDKAMLLRRLHKFYNQLINEVPDAVDSLKEKEKGCDARVGDYASQLAESKRQIEALKKENEELKAQLLATKDENEKLADESNRKTVVISSVQFDLDVAKGEAVQAQFKLKKKKEKMRSLKKAVRDLESEEKNQLAQIDELTKELQLFHQGETGYIVQYHEAKAKFHDAEAKIKELEGQIYALEHIPKADACVDTSDIPVPVKKKKKGGKEQKRGGSPSGRISLADSDKPAERGLVRSLSSFKRSPVIRRTQHSKLKKTVSSSMSLVAIPDLPEVAQIEPSASFSSLLTDVQADMLYQETETQTTSRSLTETKNPEAETTEATAVSGRAGDAEQAEATVEGNFDVDSIAFKEVPGYNVDHSGLENLPDVMKIVMPLLAQPYVPVTAHSLRIVTVGATATVVKGEKNLIWALRIIHSFLLDPYVRASENQTRNSIESLFVDWIVNQYKIQHLVNQVIADFADVLAKHKAADQMLQFFSEILESKVSMSSLCFLAALYSFSSTFTYPNIYTTLENLNDDIFEPRIHVLSATKILQRCFTDKVAATFMKDRVNAEKPLIDYVKFLRDATEFFDKQHEEIYEKTKALLFVCGSAESRLIGYDTFHRFMGFLSGDIDTKREWKTTMIRKQERATSVVNIHEVLTVCVDKRIPFLNLIALPQITDSVAKMKNLSPHIVEFFYGLITRYTKIKPRIYPRLTEAQTTKLNSIVDDLRYSLLVIDLPRSIFCYRLFLSKLDRVTLKDKGFVPFHVNSPPEIISQVVKYLDKSEKVAFALLSDTKETEN